MSAPETHPSESDARRGVLLALLSVGFAAVFLLAYQSATRSAPRSAVVLAMLAGSTLFNALFAVGRAAMSRRARDLGARASLRPSRAAVIATLVLAALSVTGNLGVAGALASLDPGLTSTLLQTQVFVVGAAGALFLGERITPAMVVGALFAIGGFAVLSLDLGAASSIDLAGVGFALMGSFSFGAMLVYTRAVVTRIDPVAVNVARLALAVLAMGVVIVPAGGLAQIDPRGWLMVAIAAACGPFISRLCLMFALRHITASRTKLLTLLTPAAAFVLEVVVLGAMPETRELVGATLILLGVLLPTLLAARRSTAAAS